VPLPWTVLAQSSSSESDGVSLELLVVAAVVAVAWLLVVLVAVAARRPPHVDAAPATQELPPVPPAVAGLLCDDFELPSEVVPATVLDLAARKVFTLEEVQPGHTICRLRRGGDDVPLGTYEREVLHMVGARAVDGIVPTDALTTGTEAASERWHRGFARAVVEESQARGLTRDRYPKRLLGILGLGPLAVVGLIVLAFVVGGDTENGRGVAAGVAGGIAGLTTLLLGAILGRLGRSLAQLPTPEGTRVTALSLGLQAHLRENEHFDELPPAAVTIWGRHFAYAAAMGVARLAVELLPMGAEDDHRAWSRFGGRWHRVKVRYPRARPPAWGKHPAFALLLAVLWGTVAVFALRFLVHLASDTDDVFGPSSTFERDTLDWIGRGALIAIVPLGLLLVWAVYVLVRAVPDLWLRRTTTAELVRARRRQQVFKSGDDPKYWYYLALDDGTHAKLRAFRVRRQLYTDAQGQMVTAVFTPNLGYVRELRVAVPTTPPSSGVASTG
jgi:hypothetical protein